MSICEGITLTGKRCSRQIAQDKKFCLQHSPEKMKERCDGVFANGKPCTRWAKINGKCQLHSGVVVTKKEASLEIPNDWEKFYDEQYEGNKYKKNTKHFSKMIYGKSVETPNIYIIPRQRGGPSYKDVELEKDDVENIQFCPISKGFSMQDVSSFTLGPIVGHGLNVVNSAFSKTIAIKHIDGSGSYDGTHKKFWKKNRKGPARDIENISDVLMEVDGVIVEKEEWLEKNKKLWFDDWKKWHDAIRLNPNGNFRWCDDSEEIVFCNCIDKPGVNIYMDFVTWKKTCYIEPAYVLFEKNNQVIEFLKSLFFEKKISIGLVHPMGKKGKKEKAITKEFLRELFDSPNEMTCMPYVVAGYLLGV